MNDSPVVTDQGPLRTLDRALALARRGGVPLWRSLSGGAVVAVTVLGVHYVERIEGITEARPLLAFALVLAFWSRAVLLAGAARDAVRALSAEIILPEGAGRAVDVVRTASVVGLGLSLWLLLLIVASYLGPFAVPLVLPLLALRGAVAPSWIARSGVTGRGGVRGFLAATVDQEGRRGAGVFVELLVLLGALGLALNLYVSLTVFLFLGRSMLGVDLALLDSFLSTRNVFVLLAVGAAALVLLEPLRVALSATYFVDAQIRREGLDLYRAIDQAERAAVARGHGGLSGRAGSSASRGVAAALVLLTLASVGFMAGRAQAQESYSDPDAVPSVPMPAVEPLEARADPEDDAVRDEARRILAAPAYREFAEARGRGLRTLVERLFAYLMRPRDTPDLDLDRGLTIPMPPISVFLVLGALLLVVVVAALIATRARGGAAAGAVAAVTHDEVADPRDRPPEAHLDDAAALAALGRHREALRSLYLATLVSLDRRRLITFDPTRTNWHYLREMPRGARRDELDAFTRLFDHKWYGDEPTTHDDYAACRSLADRICASEATT